MFMNKIKNVLSNGVNAGISTFQDKGKPYVITGAVMTGVGTTAVVAVGPVTATTSATAVVVSTAGTVLAWGGVALAWAPFVVGFANGLITGKEISLPEGEGE